MIRYSIEKMSKCKEVAERLSIELVMILFLEDTTDRNDTYIFGGFWQRMGIELGTSGLLDRVPTLILINFM